MDLYVHVYALGISTHFLIFATGMFRIVSLLRSAKGYNC